MFHESFPIPSFSRSRRTSFLCGTVRHRQKITAVSREHSHPRTSTKKWRIFIGDSPENGGKIMEKLDVLHDFTWFHQEQNEWFDIWLTKKNWAYIPYPLVMENKKQSMEHQDFCKSIDFPYVTNCQRVIPWFLLVDEGIPPSAGPPWCDVCFQHELVRSCSIYPRVMTNIAMV